MNIDISWMVGRIVDRVSWMEPGRWVFHFGGGGSISCECLWRLIADGRIIRTSDDHGQEFGLSAPVDACAEISRRFSKQRVRLAEVRKDTRDIILAFESSDRLEVLPISSGYESWEVEDPNGSAVIATGGGDLVPRS